MSDWLYNRATVIVSKSEILLVQVLKSNYCHGCTDNFPCFRGNS